MKDMKETRKMLEFYRSRVRINTFFMPISILLFILLGIVFFCDADMVAGNNSIRVWRHFYGVIYMGI